MHSYKKLNFFAVVFLALFVSVLFIAPTAPTLALADGERLMQTELRIGGGDILMCTSDVDADDWQLNLQSGGGTQLLPQVDDLIFEKAIDVDITDSQIMMQGMNSAQYDDEVFINNSCDSGVLIEETGGNADPVETTAFSIGSEFGYGKTTVNVDSSDTYAGYYWQTDFFDDVDNDGTQDDAEYGYLPDFDEDSYIMIGAKADWTNISTVAGDDVAEISLVFTTSGSDFEIEAKITADADGNTGWSNMDDGSADNKMTFLYANADAQFVAFYFDLSMLNNYDEDDLSSIKGLDYIDYRITSYGSSSTAELWVYYVAFVKNPSVWNFGSYDRPAITSQGTHDIPKTFIPSLTAAAETDGGMYLNYATLDVPVTTVTESGDVTSAYTNLINIDEQLVDGDIIPLNWRKIKFESDQGETNKEDDRNLALLPTSYKPEIIRSHPDGGVEVRETFLWDMTGLDDIDTSTYLMTWDASTDYVYVEDRILYDNLASDIWDTKDPSTCVLESYEGLAATDEQNKDVTKDLQSAWNGEADEVFAQYTLSKQPDTSDGDILKFVRHVRYDADYVKDLNVVAAEGSPFWIQTVQTPVIFALGIIGLVLGIIGVSKIRGKK